MSVNFAQLFNTQFIQQPFYIGALVNATVIQIEKDYIVADANLKSESWIPIEQFINPDGELEVEVENQIEVVIEALEDSLGETQLSRIEAKRIAAWANLQNAYDSKESVFGTITNKVKGGFTVDMHILQGFLPGSLIDPQQFRDMHITENAQPLEFKITKLDPRRNNIVLSRRAVLESEGQANRELFISQLEPGQIVEGYVKPNFENYGVFIDLGGVDGLLHNTHIAWKKIKHPSEVLTPSTGPEDKIKVKILKIERTANGPRISLGLKQLSADPWHNIEERYAVGQLLEKRKVTHVKEYGCFVEIEPGIEGLVHTTQMDWTNRNPNPYAIVQQEQDEAGRLDVVILGIEIDFAQDKRRISLGIKQAKENPWKTFAERHQEGEHIVGKIRSITDLGLFINLEGNIDGLVHHSTIGDHFSADTVMRGFKKGSDIEVKILSIDPIKERIALSISQREPRDPENVENQDTIQTDVGSSTVDTTDVNDAADQGSASVSADHDVPDTNITANVVPETGDQSNSPTEEAAEELITNSLQDIAESSTEDDPLLANAKEFEEDTSADRSIEIEEKSLNEDNVQVDNAPSSENIDSKGSTEPSEESK